MIRRHRKLIGLAALLGLISVISVLSLLVGSRQNRSAEITMPVVEIADEESRPRRGGAPATEVDPSQIEYRPLPGDIERGMKADEIEQYKRWEDSGLFRFPRPKSNHDE